MKMSFDHSNETELFSYQYPRAANTSSMIVWAKENPREEGIWKDNRIFVLGIIRGNDPYKGMLALPGGFHDPLDNETLEETASRELKEETGLVYSPEHFKLVCVQSLPTRDPREHVIDHVYSCETSYYMLKDAVAGDDAAAIKIIDPKLQNYEWAFDHGDSINKFLQTF